MSLYRQVKTLFTVSSLIFTYIIWTIVSAVLFNNTSNYALYIISLFSVFLMQYLRGKEKKIVFQVFIPLVSAIFINVLIYDIYAARNNSLYIFFILIFFKRLENEEINFEMYKSRVSKIIYTLIALGTILPLINKGLTQNVLRFYLVYLISAIILLREARKFTNRISNKKSVFVNLSIIFSVIILSINKIYNFLTMIFSYVWSVISFALSEITLGITYILIYIIFKPFYFILKLIFSYLGKKGNEYNIKVNNGVNLSKYPSLLEQKGLNNVFLFVIILKISIVIILAYLMFRVFDSYVKKGNYNEEGEVQKEKILRKKENKKDKDGNLSRLMKVFKRKPDVRTQILNVYLKFEQKMSDKEIYKPHMTAGQLSSVAKTQFDDTEAINSITRIYNEAKFSNHEVPEKNVKTIKLNYESIRKKV